MRIGIDCRLWNQTGVGRYIRNLVQNLLVIDKDNSYVLFVRKQDYGNIKYQISNIKYPNKFKIKNLKLKIIEADIPWHSIREQVELPKILKKENLNLVHFPYISVPIFLNIPFIITIHDLIPYYFLTGKASTLPYPIYRAKRLGYKFVLKNAILNSKKIIVPSNAVKDEILKISKIDENKIVVTYEAADEKFKVQSSKFKVYDYGRCFLYVGNAYPHKNLETLVLAFSKLIGSKNKLIIVGKEDYFLKRIKEFTDKLGNSQKIIFIGQVSDDELSTLYSNALCLVVPSFSEGFSLPVLEAMSLKCPILLSDIAVHKEIAKDCALYFDPKNAEDLKNKMEEIIKGKANLKETKEKAFDRSKEFTWRKTAQQTLKTYKSL